MFQQPEDPWVANQQECLTLSEDLPLSEAKHYVGFRAAAFLQQMAGQCQPHMSRSFPLSFPRPRLSSARTLPCTADSFPSSAQAC